jgi:(E)-4-hydroxy-3-methylbut-2-enyl-diphosphate synthase
MPGFDPYVYARRHTRRLDLAGLAIGNEEPIRVELDLGEIDGSPDACARELASALARLRDVGCEGLAVRIDDEAAGSRLGELRGKLSEAGIDLPFAARLPVGLLDAGVAVPDGVSRVVVPIDGRASFGALRSAADAASVAGAALEWCLQLAPGGLDELPELVVRALEAVDEGQRSRLSFSTESLSPCHATRLLAAVLEACGLPDVPIVLRHRRDRAARDDAALIEVAVDLGVPLIDGLGDAVSLSGFADASEAVDLAYRVLQGARRRTTRTEYISCPSCGRTLFDLEETTARIKAETEHLKGVKIAIMGCIVNGPGEMADADFGYVGSGPGVVTLYVGKKIVARAIPEAEAPDRLIALIQEHGSWQHAEPDSD